MAINLYSSNRLEKLAEKCAALFHDDPLSPLVPEIIVVQSRGMARWLSMQFAGHLSIWANGRFPFPNKFVSEIFSDVLGRGSDTSFYDRKKAVWQFMDLLGQSAEESFVDKSLSSYLADPLKRFQLAGQLADLFDQYIIYRPDLLLSWEQGEGNDWQAELWRMMCLRYEQSNRAVVLQDFLKKLQADPPRLPHRLTLFGISSLSPFHLEVFNALSNHIQVNLFFMNPCPHWWGDIVPEKEILRRESSRKGDDSSYFESGNPLLASMGHLARDFLCLLQDRNCREYDLFVDEDDTSALSSIQHDILELNCGEVPCDKDDSIIINSCHSRMREVEILQDHLLALFDNDSSLASGDIIVMAPDIELYSPLVQAVFDLEYDHPHYIPFAVADRKAGSGSRLIEAFFALLDLAGGRFEASQIVQMVKKTAFRNRFSLSEADCVLFEKWVQDLAICWGKDKDHKLMHGLPDYEENTWQAGLDRLLLGYAMQGGDEFFAGMLPYANFDESDTELLGRVLESLSVLFGWLEKLPEKRDLRRWSEDLYHLLDECFMPGQEEDISLQTALGELAEMEDQSGFSEEIGLDVLRCHLQLAVNEEKSARGFLSGGVTFCSLLPMRAIPFKVVCLIGMNDGEFPRPRFASTFDMINRFPRAGDRNSRLDDRYLFLEALVSARQQLYISFQGQSVRDDTDLPPSVLVSELIDYMGRGDAVCRHRLQPFHPDYFSGGKVFCSYSLENFKAAQRLVQGPDAKAGFWQGLPLGEPDGSFYRIGLHDLSDFFVHPVRFFCRKRLQVDIYEEDRLINDNEPFCLDGLARYQFASEFLRQLMQKKDTEEVIQIWKAKGLLPHGRMAEIESGEVRQEVLVFYERVRDDLSPSAQSLDFDVKIKEFQISGNIDTMTETGALFLRPAKIKGRDLLRAWISHLILHECADIAGKETVLVGTDRTILLPSLACGSGHLENLLELYWLGLREPLPFFSETSYDFAAYACKGNLLQARKKARDRWHNNYMGNGEGEDVYLKFRYRADEEVLDNRFEELALRIYGPVLQLMEEKNG